MTDGSNSGADRAKAHNAPCSNRDFDFFYNGLEKGQLLMQKCRSCGTLRNPPGPACAHCHSLDWDAIPLSGRGVLHSFTIHHHPPLPGFDVPHPIGLADMEEGLRLVGAMDGTAPGDMRIGMPVEIEYLRRGNVAAFRFRAR